jgi:hypothetical protein
MVLQGVSRCDGFTKFFKEDNVDLTGGRDMARFLCYCLFTYLPQKCLSHNH